MSSPLRFFLLSCSRSTSFDSVFMLRRAPLPIIEPQKSPWNVSDVQKVCELFCHGQVFSRSKKVFFPRPRIPMKRFLSSRSSSQQELQPLDDVRAEWAAIALSVGLSWPPDRYTKTRGRPSWQQLWERVLQDHILNHHEGIRLQRSAWCRPGEAIDRPLTHEEHAHIKTPCAAAAPVEDEPSGSVSKRRKIHIDPIARDWFLDMLDQWRTDRRWDMQRCLCEVQRLCPELFVGINPNTPYRWKRSGQKKHTFARRHDAAQRAHHAGDRRAVPELGDYQGPGVRMARRNGTRRPFW